MCHTCGDVCIIFMVRVVMTCCGICMRCAVDVRRLYCGVGACDGMAYAGCDMWCATGCMLLVVSAYVFGYLLVVCVALYCTMYTIVCVRCVYVWVGGGCRCVRL